jgi:hypothetical protein
MSSNHSGSRDFLYRIVEIKAIHRDFLKTTTPPPEFLQILKLQWVRILRI